MAATAVAITAVNDPPVLVEDASLTLMVGNTAPITSTQLMVSDPDNRPADLSYTLEGVPGKGQLLLNGVVLNQNDHFTQADIDAGRLNYFAVSPGGDSFVFRVSDGTGGKGSPDWR